MYIANVMTHVMTHNARQGTLPSRSATLFSSTSRSFVDCVETLPVRIATYNTPHLIIASIIVRDMNEHIKTDLRSLKICSRFTIIAPTCPKQSTTNILFGCQMEFLYSNQM